MREWKDIEGYEGLYQISNDGIVRNQKTGKIKKDTNSKGYRRVGLFKNSIGKWFAVHRLVAEAFIPNPDNLPVVNHKDEDKTNNKVENLEWCTVEYNNRYGTAPKRHGLTQRNRPDCSKQVEQYDLNDNLVKVYNSVSETRYYGFCYSSVSKCCRGERKTHKKFKWCFKDAESKD